MSELNNPLFDDQREFLERQKEEYKNALLSDVADLKGQSMEMGKKLLVAGGLLAGIYYIGKTINRSRDDDKPKKKKLKRLENAARFKGAEDRAWISSIPDIEDDEPLYSAIERTYPAVYHPTTGTLSAAGYGTYHQEEDTSMVKSFLKSDLFRLLEQQLAAILMIYLTKLIEKQLTSATQQQPILLEAVDTEIVYELSPDPTSDAPPLES